jgi:hypothetical protein
MVFHAFCNLCEGSSEFSLSYEKQKGNWGGTDWAGFPALALGEN